MNPLVLLLLAAAARGGNMPGMAQGVPFQLNTVLDQLHGAINTLEKVSELSRMGSNLSNAAPLPSPSSAHIPASAAPVKEQEYESQPAPAAPSLPNIDLQSAMQTLGPILSMLGNGQNSR